MTRLLPALLLAVLVSPLRAEDKTLFDFAKPVDAQRLQANNAATAVVDEGLKVTAKQGSWPGVTLKAPDGRFDLSAFRQVSVTLKNTSDQQIKLGCRVDNPGADGKENCLTATATLKPGEERVVTQVLYRQAPKGVREKLFAMKGWPNGWAEKGLRLDDITQFVIFFSEGGDGLSFVVRRVVASGAIANDIVAAAKLPADKFFPMIDVFGQYKHADWPGKTHAIADMKNAAQAEAADLRQHPGPKDWSRFGGFARGAKREATGYFHVEKIDGRWWLVDPEGCLFWSHGADCVRATTGATPITDREFYFADLPKRDVSFAEFFGHGSNAALGYYKTLKFETFDFSGANLLRKYGPNWKARFADLAHQRLRSWGMNTIANWSDAEIYGLRKTPYTATISVRGKSRAIEGSAGHWGKFSDVFDADFAAAVNRAMQAEQGRTTGDAWCLGYFVDNELSWGDAVSLPLATLASPANQPAKRALVEDLKAKYGKIDALNEAWGAKHESWDALLASTAAPDPKKAAGDLRAFATRLADRYFSTCRDAVKKVAPNQLYLGCRFAWTNELAIRSAVKHCDVVSFNHYKRTVPSRELPEGCDKPTIVGEFHFGALDRGPFHPGLVPVADQQQRAEAYKTFVRSALANANCVGTHWFQFVEQAATGRSDGENYQIGLVDICDTPYKETIAAVREVGDELYSRRLDHQGK